ncbi:MAG: monovalent cation/H+ antiporter subunit D, partial [Novosphingobium sp.]
MSHWIIAPILLPLFAGMVLLFGARWGLRVQRGLALAATAALVPLAIALLIQADTGVYQVYALGDWPAPFGIVLVLDRLSALLLALTAALALPSLLYAIRGSDAAGGNFHALFQLQLLGLNGAFLTGDLFNLFVFFEILLIASYALLLHGKGPARTRAGLHYVVLNLVGSSLFLIAVGTLYGLTGTLNMADLALRIGQAGISEAPLLRAAALLLLVVFALKAALLPLYFWLPRAYAAAHAPVAALFAIMTKMGVYAILRIYSLIFGSEAGLLADLALPWLWPLGLATLALAAIGVLAATELRSLIAYLILVSVGTLLTAMALATPAAISASLYYLLHTTLVSGGLFLLAGTIRRQRGACGDRLSETGPPLLQPALLGVLFFVAAIAMAGMPPTSGFVGKLMLLAASGPAATTALSVQGGWFWTTLLLASLLSLIALSRAGSQLFWRTEGAATATEREDPLRVLGTLLLIGASLLLVLFAVPVTDYTLATALQLADPASYIDVVLGGADPNFHAQSP